jgi:hypothetical protein
MTISYPIELMEEPGSWRLTLADDHVLDVTADSYFADGDSYVFSLMMGDHPVINLHILRIPKALVINIAGG